MTEVRIRHEADTLSAHLTDVPFDQIDTVIPTLRAWGLNVYGDNATDDMFGQFVLEEVSGSRKAYFEVIIGGAE